MKAPAETHMRREIFEIPATVETLLGKGQAAMAAAALAQREGTLTLALTSHPESDLARVNACTLAISNEAALKFKETCQLHAESYSSAEVMHGPVSIIDQGFPVLAFTAADQAEQAVVNAADAIAAKGAAVFATSDKTARAARLPVMRTAHPLTDPLSLIVSFYAMVEQVAVAQGVDPDAPRHLTKVTETL